MSCMSICKTLEPTSVQIFNYDLLQCGELHAHLQIHVVRNKLMQAPCAAPTPGSMGERLEAGEREYSVGVCRRQICRFPGENGSMQRHIQINGVALQSPYLTSRPAYRSAVQPSRERERWRRGSGRGGGGRNSIARLAREVAKRDSERGGRGARRRGVCERERGELNLTAGPRRTGGAGTTRGTGADLP